VIGAAITLIAAFFVRPRWGRQLPPLLALPLLALLTGPASAQQTPALPLATARLTWNWQPGTTTGVDDGQANGFRIKCGPASKTYSNTVDLTSPLTRDVLIRNVVKGSGAYYCVVTAYNTAGESGPSNEVFFSVTATPSPPTSLSTTEK